MVSYPKALNLHQDQVCFAWYNLWFIAPTLKEISLYEMPVTVHPADTDTSKQWCKTSPLTTHLQNAGIHFFPPAPLVRWSECSGVGVPPGHLPRQLYPPDWSPAHHPLQTYTAVLPICIKKHHASDNQPTSNATENVAKHNINTQLPPGNSTKKSPS